MQVYFVLYMFYFVLYRFICTIQVYFLLYRFYFVLYRFVLQYTSLFCTIQAYLILYRFILYYTCFILYYTSFILYYTGLFCTIQVYFVLYRFISTSVHNQNNPNLYTESCFLFSTICNQNLATDDDVFFTTPAVYRHLSPMFIHLQLSFVILLHY